MQRHETRLRMSALLLAGALVFGGCLEYETTTTILTDGSLRRSIVVTGDSTAVHSWDFRVPVDTGWTLLSQERVDEKKWRFSAERDFSSADEWNAYQSTAGRRTLVCSLRVEKSFRFFTTSYRFSETISSYNPFRLVPITDFLSPSELEAFLRFEVFKESYPTKGDSLALEDAGDRFEEWDTACRVEAFRRAIVGAISPDEPALADSAWQATFRNDLETYLTKPSKSGNKEYENPDADKLLHWLNGHTAGMDVSLQQLRSELLRIKVDVDFMQSVGSDTYVSRVGMPGTLVRTNGKPEGESGAKWENYIGYAYVNDFTMEAESSAVNVWAIVLALAVVVGGPILVWVAWITRRRRIAPKVG